MVRPCVARGLGRAGGERSCINVSGLWLELIALRAIMEISAPAVSLADRPQRAKRVTSARMRREDRSSISSILSQTSAGKGAGYADACSWSCIQRSSSLHDCLVDPPRLEGPATSKNAPGDASQLVGERNCQHVGVQPLSGRLEPRLEPVTLPILWPDQHNPRRLNEQDAQVAIATLRYLAEDRAVARRDLPG